MQLSDLLLPLHFFPLPACFATVIITQTTDDHLRWFPPSRFSADVDMDHQLGPRLLLSARTLNTLVVCPLYISAAYHHLHCFRLLLQSGAQPDFNYTGPVCQEALTRGLASCLLDAVLRHGCEAAFVHLLLDHGAKPALVPWDESELEAPNRRKVDPEALKAFLEGRSESQLHGGW